LSLDHKVEDPLCHKRVIWVTCKIKTNTDKHIQNEERIRIKMAQMMQFSCFFQDFFRGIICCSVIEKVNFLINSSVNLVECSLISSTAEKTKGYCHLSWHGWGMHRPGKYCCWRLECTCCL
jgi:hypothetical protein